MLLDPHLPRFPRLALLFGLFLEALRGDVVAARLATFAKRLAQAACEAPMPMVTGGAGGAERDPPGAAGRVAAQGQMGDE